MTGIDRGLSFAKPSSSKNVLSLIIQNIIGSSEDLTAGCRQAKVTTEWHIWSPEIDLLLVCRAGFPRARKIFASDLISLHNQQKSLLDGFNFPYGRVFMARPVRQKRHPRCERLEPCDVRWGY
jgi:hypothetical protein